MRRLPTSSLRPFFDSVLGLKKVARTGWVSKVGIKDAESVADHTFSMCAIAMVIGDASGLDTEKIMKMVILHDLAESTTGDHAPGEISSVRKKSLERDVMKRVLSKLPAMLRQEYDSLWKEYLDGSSDIARIVHRVDKLEMALQAESYLNDGHPPQHLRQFFESAQTAVGQERDLVSSVFRSLRIGREK
jgi:putative hydrolases of HD superfamily